MSSDTRTNILHDFQRTSQKIKTTRHDIEKSLKDLEGLEKILDKLFSDMEEAFKQRRKTVNKVKRVVLLVMVVMFLGGCATTITKGVWKPVLGKDDEGNEIVLKYEKVPDEYVEVKGIGGGELPGGV